MGLLIRDAYAGTPFSMLTLTERINRTGYAPKFLDALGLFRQIPMKTTKFSTEDIIFSAGLIQSSLRGGPSPIYISPKRNTNDFMTVNLKERTSVKGDSVQNVVAGAGVVVSELSPELQSPYALLDAKMVDMREKRMETTLEYWRASAVLGYQYDKDGSTIYNYFTEFNVSQSSVDMAFGTATTDIMGKFESAKAAMYIALADSGQDVTPICLCGLTFFNTLRNHARYQAAYQYRENPYPNTGDPLLDTLLKRGIYYSGIWFIVPYMGQIASKNFIPDAEGYLIPYGVDDMFLDIVAPADYMEVINTQGVPMYARMAPTDVYNRGMEVELQSQRLFVNTRPEAVTRLYTSN